MSVRDRIKRMEQMAMQEREAAPDERGRSPGGVSMASNTSASGSPRPLSKVRTSFVAIADKEGRIGLHRQPSGDSSISERKLSGDTDAASSSILLDSSRPNALSSSPDAFRSDRTRGPSGSFSRSPLHDIAAGAGTAGEPTAAPPTASTSSGAVPGAAESVAESKAPTASDATKSSGPAIGSTGAIADQSSRAPTAATSTGPVSGSSLASARGQKGLAASPQIKEASRSEEPAGQRINGGKPDQGVQQNEAQAARDRGQAQVKGSENAVDRSDNKDRAAKSNGSAVTSTTAVNGADKAKTTKPAPTSSTQPKTAVKAPEAKGMATPAAEKKPAEKKLAPSNVSPPFVKPRPKSPTQPVKLPERLTTHTGASAAKSKNAPPPVRPASRTSMAASGKGLGRSSSVTSRQHSSFGPPPKQAVDHPILKKETKVDEGFLARMMRPTQAYANKVADKVQLPPKTPPRATATKKPTSARTGPTKKTVPRSTTTSAAASPETKTVEHSSAVKQTAKKHDTIAEEPVIAKKNEEKPATTKNVAPAEKKEPMVNESKKEEHTTEAPKASEKKADLPPATAETKVEDAPKAVEKEDIAKVAEAEKVNSLPKAASEEKDKFSKESEKENVPQASENSWNFSKSTSDKKDEPSKSSEDKTFENTSGAPAFESNNAGSKPAEKEPFGSNSLGNVGPTAKSSESALNGKKASDAMFEAFMNPGSEKADVSQTNGNQAMMNGQAEKEQEEW